MITVTGTWGKNSINTYDDGEDSYIRYSYNTGDPEYPTTNTNYSDRTYLLVGRGDYGAYERALIRFKPSVQIPYCSDIIDARLCLYCSSIRTLPTMSVRRVLQPWVESEVTYNKYNYSVNWNTVGCNSAGDGPDDGVYDRYSTIMYSALASAGTWIELDITSMVRQWVNKSAKEYGVIIIAYENSSNQGAIFTSSRGTDGYRPYLKVTYNLKYYFSGVVTDQGTPAGGRKIVAHKRDTFEPMAYTTTSGDGSYYMITTYSGSHYIVCIDDDSGVQYNDKILGRMIPEEL